MDIGSAPADFQFARTGQGGVGQWKVVTDESSFSGLVIEQASAKAAITGDFVLTADEVNPIIRALRSNGIEVTAVHSHMLDEQPRLFFLHFWANDDAEKLARGLRVALDKTASITSQSTDTNSRK
jgi:hypothetical protein